MATTNVKVLCVSKLDRQNPHEQIEGIGGLNADGTRWWVTQDRAIALIESNEYAFYTGSPGHIAWVVVARSRLGHKYIRTEADTEHTNNLLSLPECP
jgi:hypothetical protein